MDWFVSDFARRESASSNASDVTLYATGASDEESGSGICDGGPLENLCSGAVSVEAGRWNNCMPIVSMSSAV